VTKLSADGTTLVYSTFLSGTMSYGMANPIDTATGIAVDSSGNAYVVGSTADSDFPTVNAVQSAFGGGYDLFVTKLSAAGDAIVYSSYLGGSGTDRGLGIAVDPGGAAYVTGSSDGAFPTTTGAYQTTFASKSGAGSSSVVIAKIAAGGSLTYSTYLQGTGSDTPVQIGVDSSGQAVVSGGTSSADFPLQNATETSGTGFLTKLNASGTGLIYSTYLFTLPALLT
jgi:hypothetical protein